MVRLKLIPRECGNGSKIEMVEIVSSDDNKNFNYPDAIVSTECFYLTNGSNEIHNRLQEGEALIIKLEIEEEE